MQRSRLLGARAALAILLIVGWAARGPLLVIWDQAAQLGDVDPNADPAVRFDREIAAIREQLPSSGQLGFLAGTSEELAVLRFYARAIAQQATTGELPTELAEEHRENVRRFARDVHRMFEAGGPFADRPFDAATIEEGLVYLMSEAVRGRSFPLTQFALAPVVLRRDWHESDWQGGLVLGHFPAKDDWQAQPAAERLRLLRVLGDERLLFEATR